METVIRVVIIYLFVMVGLRLMGSREFGELAPFDLVVLLLIPEILSQPLSREDFSLTNGIVSVSTLLLLVFATSVISYRYPRVGRTISGSPVVLVRHGDLVPQHLHRTRVRPEEIMDAMHMSGFHRMDQVQWAILEADGRISIIPWEQQGQSRPPERHTV